MQHAKSGGCQCGGSCARRAAHEGSSCSFHRQSSTVPASAPAGSARAAAAASLPPRSDLDVALHGRSDPAVPKRSPAGAVRVCAADYGPCARGSTTTHAAFTSCTCLLRVPLDSRNRCSLSRPWRRPSFAAARAAATCCWWRGCWCCCLLLRASALCAASRCL